MVDPVTTPWPEELAESFEFKLSDGINYCGSGVLNTIRLPELVASQYVCIFFRSGNSVRIRVAEGQDIAGPPASIDNQLIYHGKQLYPLFYGAMRIEVLDASGELSVRFSRA